MKEKVKLRRILAFIMALAMVIGLLPGMGPVTVSAAEKGGSEPRYDAGACAPKKPDSGDGSSNNPYEIDTAGELYWFAALVNGDTSVQGVTAANKAACAELNGDITINRDVVAAEGKLNAESSAYLQWTPIGTEDSPFTGSFKGNGYSINGLYYNDSSDAGKYVGLFGAVGDSGSIEGVSIKDSYICGNSYVSGICGCLKGGTIKNSHNAGHVKSKENREAGGIVGRIDSGRIENCYNSGNIEGKYVGGICCEYYGGSIINCYNIGSLSCANDAYGGVICSSGTFTNCYYLDYTKTDGIQDNGAVSMTIDEFNDGSLCYLLNGSTSEGTIIWRQNLGKDPYPGFKGSIVCYENGRYVNRCDVHTFEQIKETEPNCIEPGYIYKKCTTCQYEQRFNKENSAPLGHIITGDKKCTRCNVSDSALTEPPIEDGVYKISTAGQLMWFSDHVNKSSNSCSDSAELVDDIKLGVMTEGGFFGIENGESKEIKWKPIGKSGKGTYNSVNFNGTFDGKGYIISGLYCHGDDNSQSCLGLFGNIGGSGKVINLGIKDSYFYMAVNGNIYNQYCGGICGANNGTIKNCYSDCNIISKSVADHCYNHAGGICGSNKGAIQNCYSISHIDPLINTVGGICAKNDSTVINSATVNNCYYLGECFGNRTINCTEGENVNKDRLLSGEITYLLQGKQSSNVWGQKIDGQSYPAFYNETTAPKVYSKCNGTGLEYANDNESKHIFNEDTAVCNNCGAYQAPEQIDNVYQISKKGHLLWFAEHVNAGEVSASAILLNDITINNDDVSACNGTPKEGWLVWDPIGIEDFPYTGVFNGNGKKISGLYFKTNDVDRSKYVGLIGYMGKGASVHDLSLENFYISGTNNVGGICGYCNGGSISNCTVEQGLVKGDKYVGGICGYGNSGTISNCQNTESGTETGTIYGNMYVGGICGKSEKGTISNSSNGFTIDILNPEKPSEKGVYLAGICGYMDGGIINKSHNTGKVYGAQYVGGICGYQGGTVEECYNSSTATITAIKVKYNSTPFMYIGGISGYAIGSTCIMKDCYNEALIDVSNTEGTSSYTSSYYIGGVCGNLYGSGSIICSMERNYNSGEIKADSYDGVGGVCGTIECATIQDCYNTGNITGNEKVGGICGLIKDSSSWVKNCYSKANVTAGTYFGVICGYNNGLIASCYCESSKQENAVGGNKEGASAVVTGIADEAFAGGELCYQLNSFHIEGGPVWHQTIGSADYEVPTFKGEIVYYNPEADQKYFNCIGGHSLSEPIVIPATCINEGYTVQICTKCATEVIVSNSTVAATGHDVQNGKCTNCGMTSTEPTEPDEVNGVYQIGTAGELIWLRNLQNDTDTSSTSQTSYNAVLTADIKISELNKEDGKYYGLDDNVAAQWEPIGSTKSYNGTFDGNGHTISGLYIDSTNDYVGLFGRVNSASQIKNLGIIDSYIKGKDHVGALCGYCSDTTIENCYNTATVIGSQYVGGLLGRIWDAGSYTVTKCYNTGTVIGSMYVGGILGWTDNLVDRCYNSGNIKGSGSEARRVGGICGYSESNISNCYNTGTIINEGGITGGICGSGICCINCYNIGTISSETNDLYNAICGEFTNNSINCYSLEGCNAPGKVFNNNDSDEKVSIGDFHSGKIAYKLQSKQTEDVWGQNMSDTNSLPVLIKSETDKKVYGSCNGEAIIYSNTKNNDTHTMPDGICDVCHTYEEPTQDNGCYFISKAAHLLWFADYVNNGNVSANAKLANDIDLSKNSRKFISIGNDFNKYKGTFDGQGYAITVCQNNSKDVALFGTIYGATIRNLTVKGTITTSLPNAAGIAGKVFSESNNSKSVIENCISAVNIVSNMGKDGSVAAGGHGGIVASCDNRSYDVIIKNCAFTGSITGQYTNGCAGILADVKQTMGDGRIHIENCYVTAEFKLADNGGNVIANVNNKVSVKNCYYLNGLGEAPTGAAYKTADDFSSGAVTYLLNNGNTENPVWKQNIDVAETANDTYPNFTGAIVYKNTVHDCGQNTDTHSYSNKYTGITNENHVMNDETGKCSCGLVMKCKISLQSAVYENYVLKTDSVTTLSGGGLVEPGSQVTVTAPLKPGFTFKGWYVTETYSEAAKAECDKLDYTFDADSNKELTAVYEPSAKISLKVHGESGKYSVNGTTQTSDYNESIHAGSDVTVKYTGSGTFCYWKNASGKIVSTEAEYKFTIVNPTELTAVSVAASEEGKVNTSALVEFVSDYGQIIEASTWDKNNTEGKELATPPSKIGASFKHWTIEGTNVAASVESIIAAIKDNNRIVLKPVFDVDSTQNFTVKVTYPSDLSAYNEVKEQIQAGEQVTVVAKDIKGKTFSHWSSDAAGSNVLSYNKTYKLLVQKEIILYPQYVDQNVQVEEAKPIIGVTDVIKKAEGNVYKLCFEVTRSIPEKYELLEQGLIYSEQNIADNNMLIGTDGVVSIASTDTNPNGVFYVNMNVTKKKDTTIYVKGYAVIRNKETGNTETIYSSRVSGIYESH